MSSDRSVSLHIPRFALWAFGALLIAPWIAFAVWVWGGAGKMPPTAAATDATSARASESKAPPSDVASCKPGPWGNVQYFNIFLEPPEEFMQADYSRISLKPWFFKGYSAASLQALFDSANLNPAQRTFVSDPARRRVTPEGIWLTPDAAFIMSLSAESRATLYTALGEFIENLSQYNPFRLRMVAADQWLENANVPADALAMTKSLFYRRGNSLCFSDDALVLPALPISERAGYIKLLSRKVALVVQLRVNPGENVEPLVSYWARGGRSKDLKPLLQSLARRPDGGAIDIIHLLPRFARRLLYSYPLPSQNKIDASHDCHWTSFNFQNDLPDEGFSNIDYVQKVLVEQYYPTPGAPALGDIMMFVRRDGVVVHSCVYIADDIVFSKNGPAYTVPWILTSLEDVKAFYASSGDIEIRRFRRTDD